MRLYARLYGNLVSIGYPPLPLNLLSPLIPYVQSYIALAPSDVIRCTMNIIRYYMKKQPKCLSLKVSCSVICFCLYTSFPAFLISHSSILSCSGILRPGELGPHMYHSLVSQVSSHCPPSSLSYPPSPPCL